MNPITATAKVMQNFTICIAQPIREQMDLKQGDQVILSMDAKGQVKLTKGYANLEDLLGMSKNQFKTLGGGEAFLKKERAQWKE